MYAHCTPLHGHGFQVASGTTAVYKAKPKLKKKYYK